MRQTREPKPRVKRDPLLAGYQFLYQTDKTPHDFLTDPQTGKRPGEQQPPYGSSSAYLRAGADDYTLPPVKIWREGFWLKDWDSEALGKEPYSRGEDRNNVWVCPGEGTPGNFVWRLYTLPTEFTADRTPPHPVNWPKRLKSNDKNWRTTGVFGSKTGVQTQGTGLPRNLRVRCQGCGHWFDPEDLTVHVKHCCPAAHGHADWQIMCAEECGCLTLDQVATPKTGYPKQPVTSHSETTTNGGEQHESERAAQEAGESQGAIERDHPDS